VTSPSNWNSKYCLPRSYCVYWPLRYSPVTSLACGAYGTQVHDPSTNDVPPSISYCRVLTQRVTKTSLYLQMFEESINRKSKYSMAATEEFCMRPDMFLERWVTLCV
jgi:hypothetical protein